MRTKGIPPAWLVARSRLRVIAETRRNSAACLSEKTNSGGNGAAAGRSRFSNLFCIFFSRKCSRHACCAPRPRKRSGIVKNDVLIADRPPLKIGAAGASRIKAQTCRASLLLAARRTACKMLNLSAQPRARRGFSAIILHYRKISTDENPSLSRFHQDSPDRTSRAARAETSSLLC